MSNENNEKRSNKKKLAILVGTTLILISFILCIIYYNYVKSKIYTEYKPIEIKLVEENIDTVDTVDTVKYEEVEGITNVLLIGTDARDLNEDARADSIIIATLDNNNKEIRLTSLFRDTLVNIPGWGEGKLNAAMAYGGKDLLIETIRQTYDISLDKYIIINFWGFEEVIDQIGGLEIDVKEYQLDELNKYIGESTGGNDCPVNQAGLQLLNGKQALSYSRIRKGVGDEFERTERQREVLFKVAEKLRETSPTKYFGIMNSMLDYVNTNVDPLEALNLAYTIFKFPTLETKQIHLPLTTLSDTMDYKNVGSVFVMDRIQNAEVLQNFIYKDIMPEDYEIDYGSLYSILEEYKNNSKSVATERTIEETDSSNKEENYEYNSNEQELYESYSEINDEYNYDCEYENLIINGFE